MTEYRNEWKYLCTEVDLEVLRRRIAPLMPLDRNQKGMASYNIRSLYFDDYSNRCYYENENGTDPREKFRIRIYNHSADRITLECKRKEKGKTQKTSCPLTLDQADQLIQGKPLPQIDMLPPLLRKFILEMRTKGLHPVVIVEYERIPYVCKNGNVRVTFDTQISSSSNVTDFFSDTLPRRPIMPVGQHLMEVKFDEYLPDFIYRSLNLGSLRQTAYSKYYLCRKYTLHK